VTSQQSPPGEDRFSTQVASHCQALAERGYGKGFRCVSGRVLYEGHNRGGGPRRRSKQMGEVGHSRWSWRWPLLELSGIRETRISSQAQVASRECQIGEIHCLATP
jgi:hypothetical protein